MIKTSMAVFLSVAVLSLGLVNCSDLTTSNQDKELNYTFNINGITYTAGDTLNSVGQLIKTNDSDDRIFYPIYVDSDDGKLTLLPMGHPSSNDYYQPYVLPEDLQIDSLWVTFKGIFLQIHPKVWLMEDPPFEILELSVDEPTDSSFATQHVEYYPLTVGNRWTYQQIEVGQHSIEVTSVCKVGVHVYYMMTQSALSTSMIMRWLVRAEDGRIYNRIEGQDYLFLDFTRSIGEQWQQGQSYAIITSRSETISTSNGLITNCIKIISNSELDKVELLYAPGIGKVYSSIIESSLIVIGGNVNLLSAVIDGQEILVFTEP
ncbi:MAG: hypothetical protein KAV45_12885 [Calditrichia bacterium]|jgi:hypothetical protein|nr:hypothetical protein [Calditrichia bacterium]